MPACLAGVIKVAATYDTSDTVWADSHTVNPSTLGQGETILLAPGCTITSATWPTTPSSTLGACGTSLAAPHVSGLYAVLKTAVPGAEVGDLSAWILANGVNVPVPGAGYSIKRIHVPNL